MNKNANDISYQRVLLLGQYDALLSFERIDKATIPTGLYRYDIRHSDSCWASPATIEPGVGVNWYGTILCKEPIELSSNRDNPLDPYRKVMARSFQNKEKDVSLSEWLTASRIRVVVVKPLEKPVADWIDNDLASLQAMVGGDIEAVYPFGNDPAVLVCNENGKLLNLPPNRLLKDDRGNMRDVLCGTFFIAGVGEEGFISLTETQVREYIKMYRDEVLLPAPAVTKKPKQQER